MIRVARTLALEALWRGVREKDVAAADVASANRFALPGVLCARNGAILLPAEAQARSVGSWSDGLRVATALSATGFALEAYGALPSDVEPRVGFRTRAALQPGDLIELDDLAPASAGPVRAFASIDRVSIAASGGTAVRAVEATILAAFTTLGGVSFAGVGTAEILGVTAAPLAATLQADPAATAGARLHFTVAVPAGVAEGQWVRWHDGGPPLWLRIDAMSARATTSGPGLTDVALEGPAWRETTLPPLPPAPPRRALLLALDLRAASGRDDAARLGGIGLTPLHRAGWWQQTGDDRYYAMQPDRPGFAGIDTERGARDFPLAALDEEVDRPPRAFIPLGVNALHGAAPGPLPQPGTALERDGLSRFDAELFLDPELAQLRIDTLMAEADAIRFVRAAPRALFGLHAAFSVGAGGLYNEASLIAVPDALHVGWMRRVDPLPLPPASAPTEPPASWFTHRGPCAAVPAEAGSEPDFAQFLDCGTRLLAAPALSGPLSVRLGAFRLTWTASEPGGEYLLEEAERENFADAREIYRGSALHADVQAGREGVLYYRVSARVGDERNAASNAIVVTVRDEAWSLATSADFAASGEDELVRVHRAVLRLAAASGQLLAVLAMPRHYRAPDVLRYAARLRAARGTAEPDAFDFNEGGALSYGALYHPWQVSGTLQAPRAVDTTVPPGTAPSRRPRAAVNRQRVLPPDGSMAGVLAARASRRGAWIAPANEPLKDVVALTPLIEDETWPALQEAQVNLILDHARGFLTLGADTLAAELDRRPINVRRLLILLRRLALRRSTSYVFEPYGEMLRRSVERGFTLLLTDMFERGAFAGATADKSFKVVTEGAINTDQDRDAGRFLVELRVAPSWPLQFLTVRLAQSGDRLTVTEEL